MELEKRYLPLTSEKEKYKSIVAEAKKVQWLAVRLLLKELDEYAEIYYDSFNKPCLKNSVEHISISHTSEYAVLLLDAKGPVGTDVEKISDKVISIAHKFMSETEMSCISENDKASHLTLFWCAKESVYKIYGQKELLFKEHIQVEPFAYGQSGNINVHLVNGNTDKFYKLYFQNLEEHKLVYSINE